MIQTPYTYIPTQTFRTHPKFSNMKESLYVVEAHNLSLSLPLCRANNSQRLISYNEVRGLSFRVRISWPKNASCVVKQQNKDHNNDGFVVKCAKWGLVTELERELEAEEKGIARFRHKCGERKGVVELLECLEREAIMGEDVGKEPMDYNRRAQIFDRSSIVFQAQKELNNDDFTQQDPKSKEVTSM